MNVEEAKKRKERSEAILIEEGVPVNKHLPCVETEEEIKCRSINEIAYRALALLVVAVKGEGAEQSEIEKVIKEYNLESYFTPKEQDFIKNSSPAKHDSIQFTWRYEAAWVLLWSLGYVGELERPVAVCDVSKAVTFMMDRTLEQFIADAKLRPLSEILDQLDIIYRYDWAIVDARINNQEPPTDLDSGVVYERHYAFNWLVGYMEQEWDKITTDT